jgi:hypothetical protein
MAGSRYGHGEAGCADDSRLGHLHEHGRRESLGHGRSHHRDDASWENREHSSPGAAMESANGVDIGQQAI